MLATKTDGSLWSWGKKDQGALGLNQGGDNHFSSPKQVGSDTTWANGKDQIAAGRQMSFAIKTDGTLWSWGYNYHGALGISASPGSAGRKSSPTQVPGTTWSKIHCSLYTTIATKTDGTLWAWGRNNLGQLAQVGEDNNDSNSPVQIPGTTWSKATHYSYHTVHALKTDGTLWAWGLDHRGSLGLSGTPGVTPALETRSSPVQIGTDTDWIDIKTVYFGVNALKSGL